MYISLYARRDMRISRYYIRELEIFADTRTVIAVFFFIRKHRC